MPLASAVAVAHAWSRSQASDAVLRLVTVSRSPGRSVIGAMGNSRSRVTSRTTSTSVDVPTAAHLPCAKSNGQVVKNGPIAPSNAESINAESCDRMTTSASPAAPLTGTVAFTVGSTAGNTPATIPPSDCPNANRSLPGFAALALKFCCPSASVTSTGQIGGPATSGTPSLLKSPLRIRRIVPTWPVSCCTVVVPSKVRR